MIHKKIYSIIASILVLFLFINAISGKIKTIWTCDFEEEDWRKDWNILDEKQFGAGNITIINSETDHKNVLRIIYPKGSASPNVNKTEGKPIGGCQFLAKKGNYDSLYFRYYIRFKDKFEFVKGGKIPGLYGGEANSGGKIPNGYDGFSTRLMWREEGMGEAYAYIPESQTWGTSIGKSNWQFSPGKWYCVELKIKLNDPEEKNGLIQLWINGKEKVLSENISFRKTDQLKIEGIFFSTFFGGNDSSWSTPDDTYIDFDDFAISNEYIGPKADYKATKK